MFGQTGCSRLSVGRMVLGLILVFSTSGWGEENPPIEKLDPNFAVQEPGTEVQWYDLRLLGLEGQGWPDVKEPYDRLPARAEGVVRDAVWSLSRHSAGICARFITDSRKISARWVLRSENLAMPHMPATGVSGLDLYARSKEGWRWVANGRPISTTNEVVLLSNASGELQEYLLYLPLYNGVTRVEVGVDPGKILAKAPDRKARPILFYGTSITQGGCASRPGMAHPAIVGRHLDVPVINLGFSGNGKMDPEIVDLLVEVDPSVYIIDCCPNMDGPLISERTAPLVKKLREAHPDTPILLVESIESQRSWFPEGTSKGPSERNVALRGAYEGLLKDGVPGLHYLKNESLLGQDSEGTVDGVHPNDLGFHRFAEVFTPVLRGLLE